MDEELLDENDDENEDRPLRPTEEQPAQLGDEGYPRTIDEALRARTDIFSKAIIGILQGRPNLSCVRTKMPVYILKRWNIRTRGEPWQRFAKKVDNVIAVMARKGYVTIYKSKNVRIKLGWERYPNIDPRNKNYTLF